MGVGALIYNLENRAFKSFGVSNIKSLEMSKETKARVAAAFRAMKALNISGEKVKPVLKNLLRLYDKNWALIEDENYRALADAIFDRDQREVEQRSKKTLNNDAVEQSKKIVNTEKEEAQVPEEPEKLSKKFRLGYHYEKRGTKVDSPQLPSREKRPAPESSSRGACLKEPKIEPGGILLSTGKANTECQASIVPKDEPVNDNKPSLEAMSGLAPLLHEALSGDSDEVAKLKEELVNSEAAIRALTNHQKDQSMSKHGQTTITNYNI
ncbi:SET-domain containing protein lysinemethyltransferase family protein [Striga asiatica]|uniref:SET-domain containing protein lysinemethyltransferase family protein n=1 Tax=Striga asiatica TaxID=4170 RepID=A0A5A7RIR1_STRAF|nr:SET-domain containing protein lysinemethyltransferase family protein [Striga asiatica]